MNASARLALVLASVFALPAALAAQPVKPVVDRVAAAWQRADASSVAALASRDGITVQIEGRRSGPLAPRQVAATLREVFQDRETVTARAGTARPAGGSPQRAFGEISWTTRVRGTTIPQRTTVVVGFVLEDEAWRITEIRVMR